MVWKESMSILSKLSSTLKDAHAYHQTTFVGDPTNPQLKGSEKSPQSHTQDAIFWWRDIDFAAHTARISCKWAQLYSFSIMWSLGSILFKQRSAGKKRWHFTSQTGEIACSGNHQCLQTFIMKCVLRTLSQHAAPPIAQTNRSQPNLNTGVLREYSHVLKGLCQETFDV